MANLCRRADTQPTDDARVCSCHFRDGDFENLPTLFRRNDFNDNSLTFISPEKKRRRRSRKQSKMERLSELVRFDLQVDETE